MVGIYEDSFIDFLKSHLSYVKVKSKNIITECPWCEYGEKKDHYHLYISLTSPIFHCFHGECQTSGTIKKLILKLTGIDTSDKYVDREKIKEIAKTSFVKINENLKNKPLNIILPEINEENYKLKALYLKQRFKFQNINLKNINGLILDIEKFLELNKNTIKLDSEILRLKDYLCSNFVAFLTENKSKVIFRNIDPISTFKHYKLEIQQSKFLDYYKILGNNYHSNNIILSEGIFDILLEHIFDSTNLRNNVKLYAAGLSTSYESLLKSIIFHEQIFKPDVTILSDIDIRIGFYKKLKKENEHLINSLTVCYNTRGKDFAEIPVECHKIIV